MIRRYSRPRHLTAGCNGPREPVATNDNGLTTAPSPPLSVKRGPPPSCSRLARWIGQVEDLIRSGHQQRAAVPTDAYCWRTNSSAFADQGMSSQSRHTQFVLN
jgi:hypothetical protein